MLTSKSNIEKDDWIGSLAIAISHPDRGLA